MDNQSDGNWLNLANFQSIGNGNWLNLANFHDRDKLVHQTDDTFGIGNGNWLIGNHHHHISLCVSVCRKKLIPQLLCQLEKKFPAIYFLNVYVGVLLFFVSHWSRI